MWFCDRCGTRNEGNARFCVECGSPRPDETVLIDENPRAERAGRDPGWTQPGEAARYAPPPQKPKKKSLWWVWLLAGLGTLTLALVICFFTVHIWAPATCTEPQTCRLCGKTEGFPLGHDARPATCTEPSVCTRCGEILTPKLGHDADPATCSESSVCRRCGETVSPALGHDWQAATYDEPETCSRCGDTRGLRKGWIGDLDGQVDRQDLYLYGSNQSHAYVLDTPVYNCLRLTLCLKLTDVSGDPYGTWALFARDFQGNWKRLDTFFVGRTAFNNYVTFDFELDGSYSFDALSLVPITDSDYSISFSFYYENAQEYLG